MKTENKYEVGNGWIPLILDAEKAVDEWNKNNPNEEFPLEFVQIKEKFGGLRLYLNHYPTSVYNKLKELEDESYHTCENCGTKENVHTKPIYGWYITLCDECRKKEIEEYENLAK